MFNYLTFKHNKVQFSLFWRRLNVSVFFLFFFFFFEVGLLSVVIAMLVYILKLKSRFVLFCVVFFLKKIDYNCFFFNWYSNSVTSHFNPDLPHLIPNQNMLDKEKLEAEEEMFF
jgi:hypothetical protein